MKVLVFVAWTVVSLTGGSYLVASLTGYNRRTYPVLPAHARAMIAGKERALADVAAEYQPLIFAHPENASPPAVKMWWEAIEGSESIALVYRILWENEIHPLPLLHWPYSAYRAAYYGIQDIEYVQINIRKEDGKIQRVRYEDTTADSYEATFASHRYITLDRVNGQYVESAVARGEVTPSRRQVVLLGNQLKFGIVTWSHQLRLLTESNHSYTAPVRMPLEYLSDEDYARNRLARRSQGDFVTKENVIGRVAGTILLVAFMGIPYLIYRLKRRG